MPGQGQSRQSIQSAQRQVARRQVRRKPAGPTAAQVNAATNPQPVRTAPKPPPAPSRRQVRVAKANRAQIVSGERAVPKIARQQRQQARQTQRRVNAGRRSNPLFGNPVKSFQSSEKRAIRSLAALRASDPQRYDDHLVKTLVGTKPDWNDPVAKDLLKRGQLQKSGHGYALYGGKSQASYQAPALKALEQTTRPLHAVMAALKTQVENRSLVHGQHSTLKAALRGLENKDKSTGSDVLKAAGVKSKTVRGVVGTGLDIVGDPTTIVTGGTGTIAEREALRAATRTEKAAVRAAAKAPRVERQVTAKEARRAAARAGAHGGASAKTKAERLAARQQPPLSERAATRALRDKRQTKGVLIRVGGKEVPGVRAATAHASRPLRAAGRKAVPQGVRRTARHLASELNPDVVPVGASRAATQTVNQGLRTARAEISHGVHAGQLIGHGIREKFGEKNYQQVIDAIESNRVKGLPKELQSSVKYVRKELGKVHREELHAGIRQGTVKARAQVAVPKVTADTNATAKELAKARRAVYSAERGHARALSRMSVSQGRAEVLSRNVSGVRAEKAAGRGTKYAAGGQGVRETNLALQNARNTLKAAHAAHDTAAAAHEAEKVAAATQRAARQRVLEINKRREIAAKGYVPHALTEHAAIDEGKVSKAGFMGVGRRNPRPPSAMGRQDVRPLAAIRAEQPGRYSENLAQLTADRLAVGKTALARRKLNETLLSTGRTFKKGGSYDPSTETILHVTHGKKDTPHLREVTSRHEAEQILNEGTNGRLVIVNTELASRVHGGGVSVMGQPKHGGIVHTFDKGQAAFKRVATFTPAFHLRNIVGDMFNAYERQPAYKMPGNIVRAGRTLKAYGRSEKALKNLTPEQVGKATLKTRRYGPVTYDEVAKNLRENGAFRSGYIASELPELEHKGMQTEAKLKKISTPEKLKRLALGREDLPRLTTAMQMLREGATYKEAAQAVADQHFDYQHLTDFERNVMRRAAPFYTWSARNIPLQARTLVTRPGKLAHVQAIREEASKASGSDQQPQQVRNIYKQLKQAGVKLPSGWEKYISNYEQANAGVPINWKGHKFTLSAGLPFTDVGMIPGFAGGGALTDRAMQLLTPIVKDYFELKSNYSYFFHDQIERDNSPNVPGPSFIGGFPDSVKKKLGIVQIQDHRTGKKVWGWPAKVDYVARATPGLANTVGQLATPGTKGPGARAVSATGLKVTPVDPIKNATNLAYQRQREITKRQRSLGQQFNPKNGRKISAKNPTPEYTRLSQQLKLLNQIIYQTEQAQGFKVLPKVGGPSSGGSARPPSFDFSGASGGGSFDFSGAGGSSGGSFDFSGAGG